jgi:SAM-dependent methyltransferase
MARTPDLLSPAEARRFYDRLGRVQGWQIYERKALEDLVEHGAFAGAHSVFELGCGTGTLAARLLRDQLPEDARYSGLDISDTMVRLAGHRLRRWADRVEVRRGEAPLEIPDIDAGFDRFVCAYVLDLLPEATIAAVLEKAHHLLAPTGLLCTVNLTVGVGPLSRTLSRLWSGVAARRPMWVGGCRPIRLRELVADDRWSVHHHRVLRSFGLCSEVLVARPRATA